MSCLLVLSILARPTWADKALVTLARFAPAPRDEAPESFAETVRAFVERCP